MCFVLVKYLGSLNIELSPYLIVLNKAIFKYIFTLELWTF